MFQNWTKYTFWGRIRGYVSDSSIHEGNSYKLVVITIVPAAILEIELIAIAFDL